MKIKNKKILYFISGPAPTEKQIEEAINIGAYFRNTSLINDGDPLENCDSVCGNVPKQYLVYPVIEVVQEVEQVEQVETDDEKEELMKLLISKGIAFKNNNSVKTLKSLLEKEPDEDS
jgi:hypothetical protein